MLLYRYWLFIHILSERSIFDIIQFSFSPTEMFKKFLTSFNKLPLSNKSMVYLMWIYGVGSIITSTFVNIYIFKLHNSFAEILFYNMAFFSATFVGFSLLGWIMSVLQGNIKNMYYLSYVLFILSFLFLLVYWGHQTWYIYLFWALFGLWNGSFWNAVHTQELKNISDNDRDFYSSSISAGKDIIAILTPFLIALIFTLAHIFQFDGYIILFWILPLLYLTSFLFIKNIESYTPQQITIDDARNFFNLRKYWFGHLYFFAWWILTWITTSVMATVSIILLKSEVNIGLFQWILTILSIVLVVHLSHKRNKDNRLRYFTLICLWLCLNYVIFGIFFGVLGFVLSSLVSLFLSPLFRVSEHVYDLSLMDSIKTQNNDFYPAMVMRESILWLWRISGIITLLLISRFYWTNIEAMLSVWVVLSGIAYMLVAGAIYLWERYDMK